MDGIVNHDKAQTVLVFQQNGSGENKIRGIRTYGGERFQIKKISIDTPLPPVIDDAGDFIPARIAADLVLDYLKHPDLSYDLAALCKQLQIPEVATRKKLRNDWTYAPPICCALPRRENLGAYGVLFGAPEFSVVVQKDILVDISVLRGAPCGATWKAAEKIKGLGVETALQQLGLETQYCCTADPADWDPLYGKSPVHLAAYMHTGALKNAVEQYHENRV